MSSGLRYEEQSVPVFPWGDDVDTYYGTDLRDLALTSTEVVDPAGEVWLYNNYNPLLLGMVLERATGMSGLGVHVHQALAAARGRTRRHLEPRLR